MINLQINVAYKLCKYAKATAFFRHACILAVSQKSGTPMFCHNGTKYSLILKILPLTLCGKFAITYVINFKYSNVQLTAGNEQIFKQNWRLINFDWKLFCLARFSVIGLYIFQRCTETLGEVKFRWDFRPTTFVQGKFGLDFDLRPNFGLGLKSLRKLISPIECLTPPCLYRQTKMLTFSEKKQLIEMLVMMSLHL